MYESLTKIAVNYTSEDADYYWGKTCNSQCEMKSDILQAFHSNCIKAHRWLIHQQAKGCGLISEMAWNCLEMSSQKEKMSPQWYMMLAWENKWTEAMHQRWSVAAYVWKSNNTSWNMHHKRYFFCIILCRNDWNQSWCWNWIQHLCTVITRSWTDPTRLTNTDPECSPGSSV